MDISVAQSVYYLILVSLLISLVFILKNKHIHLLFGWKVFLIGLYKFVNIYLLLSAARRITLFHTILAYYSFEFLLTSIWRYWHYYNCYFVVYNLFFVILLLLLLTRGAQNPYNSHFLAWVALVCVAKWVGMQQNKQERQMLMNQYELIFRESDSFGISKTTLYFHVNLVSFFTLLGYQFVTSKFRDISIFFFHLNLKECVV